MPNDRNLISTSDIIMQPVIIGSQRPYLSNPVRSTTVINEMIFNAIATFIRLNSVSGKLNPVIVTSNDPYNVKFVNFIKKVSQVLYKRNFEICTTDTNKLSQLSINTVDRIKQHYDNDCIVFVDYFDSLDQSANGALSSKIFNQLNLVQGYNPNNRTPFQIKRSDIEQYIDTVDTEVDHELIHFAEDTHDFETANSLSHCFDKFIVNLNSNKSTIVNNTTLHLLIKELTELSKNEYRTRVILTGVGKNANLAAKASESFASLGIPSMYANSCHLAHGDYGFIGPNDIVIHLSRSGKTEEMIDAANHLQIIRPAAKQYLLCCQDEGTLSRFDNTFDKIIYLGGIKEFDEHGLAPTTSTLTLQLVLDMVASTVSSNIKFERYEFLELHPGGALGQMLKDEKK